MTGDRVIYADGVGPYYLGEPADVLLTGHPPANYGRTIGQKEARRLDLADKRYAERHNPTAEGTET